MNGFDRLNKMLDEWLEKHPNDEAFKQTVNYLLSRDELEPKFLNEEKTLEGLYDFIQARGKKHMNNGWCYITNEIIYAWAVMYFSLPNNLLEIKEKQGKNVSKEKTKEITQKNNVISIEKAKEKIEEKKNAQLSLFGGAV